MTLSIPTMMILTFRILCVDKIGSRAAAACITTTTTTIPTKISAPRRLQNADFPPPVLLVYGTHNEGRLGKNNNNNKDFGTRAAPKRRFPTPCSFSLRNPQRMSFGKKKNVFVLNSKNEVSRGAKATQHNHRARELRPRGISIFVA